MNYFCTLALLLEVFLINLCLKALAIARLTACSMRYPCYGYEPSYCFKFISSNTFRMTALRFFADVIGIFNSSGNDRLKNKGKVITKKV
jgi:hypothetical protein